WQRTFSADCREFWPCAGVESSMPTFQDVLQAETECLKAAESSKPGPGSPFALAFSGGGIRSATFNLGILQGLAQAKLLTRINYLSTVSGGGYIGGWLISWINRVLLGVTEVQEQLGDYQCTRQPQDAVAEPKQVSFLREYSNYMTPRLGIFGADTWAAIATYLRNVFLNQIILIMLLGAIIVMPWALLRSSSWLFWRYSSVLRAGFSGSAWAVAIAGALLLLGVAWASVQAARCSLTEKEAPPSADQAHVIGLTIVPLFLSANATMIALWLGPTGDQRW